MFSIGEPHRVKSGGGAAGARAPPIIEQGASNAICPPPPPRRIYDYTTTQTAKPTLDNEKYTRSVCLRNVCESVTTPPPPVDTNDELAVPPEYFDQVYAGVERVGGGKGRMEGGGTGVTTPPLINQHVSYNNNI